MIERWFGTLKHEHLFRGVIADGDVLDMEVYRFRVIYNTIRPHQVLDDRTPHAGYTGVEQRKTLDKRLLDGIRCRSAVRWRTQ